MSQLVELSAAAVISGIVSMSCLSMLCLEHRFPTTAENQMYATNIAQSVLDSAKSLPYNVLLANTGSIQLPLTGTETPNASSQVGTRPVFRDLQNMQYSPQTLQKGLALNSTVATETITQLEPGLLLISVTVQWQEQSGRKQLTMQSLVSQDGIHG